MRILFGAALAACALSLAGAALAQDAAPAAAAAPDAAAAPAKAGPPSVDWTVQDLLADPAAKAVIDKDLPGMEADPRLDMVKSLSLRAVAQYPEAQIDQAKLDAIQSDLAALSKPAS
jgi:hypothetical protein